jgi:hypothetical protein
MGLGATLLIEAYLAEASTACVAARFAGILQFLSFGHVFGDLGFVFGGARNFLGMRLVELSHLLLDLAEPGFGCARLPFATLPLLGV